MRLEKWLREKYPMLTRQQAREAIDAGWVLLNQSNAKKGAKIAGNSEVATELLDAHLARTRLGNPSLEFEIIHESSDFWVIDKPPLVPSHPVHLKDFATVTHWAFSRLPGLAEEFPTFQPTVTPHRLDTGTSGVLVVAKTANSYARWRQYFTEKKVNKTYLAWCWGLASFDTQTIDSPIFRDSSDPRKMSVTSKKREEGEGRTAITVIQRELTRADRTLFRVTCQTGVTHQVRVHLNSIGFPLLGDALYDEAFPSRAGSYAHHLLRAVELSSPEGKFQATKEAFINLP